mmetsp:Transcript_60635/g.94279  ORF Transcript_60635/g.94279 Transcript_60635/m.94279 type:complete len:214 (-) Transcript_60635:416-1057(-)
MLPVDWSRTLTYSFTFKSNAVILSSSSNSSSGPGKTLASPLAILTVPVVLSMSRTYSYFFNIHALRIPLLFDEAPSIFHVGLRNTKSFPCCTHLSPVDMSFNFMYSSSCKATAGFTPDALSYGCSCPGGCPSPGNHNFGPLTILCSPLRVSVTHMYSVLLNFTHDAFCPTSSGLGNHKHGPVCTRSPPDDLSEIKMYSVLSRLTPCPFEAISS